MNNLKDSFKSKRFKYGVFSTITTIFVLVVLVAINVVVGKMNLKIDLTQDKLYGLSDKTKEAIGALQEDVTIYTFYQAGTETSEENSIFWEMLSQYEANSGKIKLVNKDPAIYLTFAAQFSKNGQTAQQGDIVIESARRGKLIKSSELTIASQNPETGEDSVQIMLEYMVTNAIGYVTQEKTYVAYILTGHDEIGVSPTVQTYMDLAGFDVKAVDLVSQASVPADCDVLILTTPLAEVTDENAPNPADLSKEDADKLLAYLQGGGRAMFLIDYLPTELPNLNAVMSAYGIKYNDFFILEGDSAYHYPENNLLISPLIAQHSITNSIVNAQQITLVYAANAISVSDNVKNSIIIEPLMQTSPLAYGKNNPNAESPNKEAGDADGPFFVAVAVTDLDAPLKTKIVAVGSSFIINEELDNIVNGSNSEFFLQSLVWLTDKPAAVLIAPKSLDTSYSLSFTQKQALIIKLFGVIILPLIIFGFGFFVWSRRRNK